jgi:hypothetical protein
MATVASATAGYVWEDPGDSIMIQISMDLVERLGEAVQQSLGSGARGMEIGGLLLGRVLPGFGRTVLVEDFEPAPCEYLRGASYTLSPKDRQTLGTRLARRGTGRVVGYFRSHTRPGMYLDQDDFAVFSHYFPEPSQVFLLVRPSTEGAATGGFFFWEDGDINRRSPYRQFPFDSGQLVAGGFPITGGQPIAAPVGRPKPVAVPKPAPGVPPRARSKSHLFPQMPWMVVPVIAGLFLIAGLFVSGNRSAKPEAALPVKPSAPVDTIEPLLPQPEPQQAAVSPPVAAPEAAPVENAPATVAAPARTPKSPAARKVTTPAMPVPAPVVRVARAPVRTIEPPPTLTAPTERTLLPGAAILPAVSAAPPPEVEVSYEKPRVGVFRRAFHKIAGESDVPAAPIRKVAPIASAGAGEVDVKVFIDEWGRVSRAQVLTKRTELAGAALTAARQWQFTPARKHDKPVASEMVLHFRL